MLPWKLRKLEILPVNQNRSSVYFSLPKFQLVSCNLSFAMIWQMTCTHKIPKLCSATLKHFSWLKISISHCVQSTETKRGFVLFDRDFFILLVTVAHICKHNKQFLKHNKNIPGSQQPLSQTHHGIIETQQRFMETEHSITEAQHNNIQVYKTQYLQNTTQFSQNRTQYVFRKYCVGLIVGPSPILMEYGQLLFL